MLNFLPTEMSFLVFLFSFEFPTLEDLHSKFKKVLISKYFFLFRTLSYITLDTSSSRQARRCQCTTTCTIPHGSPQIKLALFKMQYKFPSQYLFFLGIGQIQILAYYLVVLYQYPELETCVYLGSYVIQLGKDVLETRHQRRNQNF